MCIRDSSLSHARMHTHTTTLYTYYLEKGVNICSPDLCRNKVVFIELNHFMCTEYYYCCMYPYNSNDADKVKFHLLPTV